MVLLNNLNRIKNLIDTVLNTRKNKVFLILRQKISNNRHNQRKNNRKQIYSNNKNGKLLNRIYGFINYVDYMKHINFNNCYLEAVENNNNHHKLELRNK